MYFIILYFANPSAQSLSQTLPVVWTSGGPLDAAAAAANLCLVSYACMTVCSKCLVFASRLTVSYVTIHTYIYILCSIRHI